MSSGSRQLTLPLLETVVEEVPDDFEEPDSASPGPDRRNLPTAPWTTSSLYKQLVLLVDDSVRLSITDNRHNMITVNQRNGTLEVRLHRMFLFADAHTLTHLARFITRRDRRASRVLDDFIAHHRFLITRPRRPLTLRAKGAHYDLGASLERLKRHYGIRTSDVKITWGRATAYENVRMMALGSYSYEQRIIRVHPVLDDPRVPGYFLDWVVYHELLHHLLPVEKSGRKRRLHDSRFKRLEHQFPMYREAREWEKKQLPALLES